MLNNKYRRVLSNPRLYGRLYRLTRNTWMEWHKYSYSYVH